MSSIFDVKFFWQVFVTLLVIMDPPGVVPPFLGLTRGLPAKVRNRLAWQAAVVGLGVIVGFAVFGQSILAYLGWSCHPCRPPGACCSCWWRCSC